MAKHLPWFNPLKGLLLAICVSILAALPAAAALSPAADSTQPSPDDIKVLQPSIVIPTNISLTLSMLIANGVVEGVSGSNSDFTIESSVTNYVNVNNNYGYVYISSPLTTTVTYSGKDNPNVKFSLEVTAEQNPVTYVSTNVKTVYIGSTKTITIPDYCVPLGEYSIEKVSSSDDFAGGLNFEVDGNNLTIEGLAEGVSRIKFINTKWDTYSVLDINIAPKPLISDIHVKQEAYYVPFWEIYLGPRVISGLVFNGEIEGILPSEWGYFIPTCDDTRMVIKYDDSQGYYTTFPTETGTYKVKYTHELFPDITFDITYIFKRCIDEFIQEYKLGFIYVGQKIEAQLPDDYIPLSAYEKLEVDSIGRLGLISLEVDTETNKIVLTGLRKGASWIRYSLPVLTGTPSFSNIGRTVNVVEKPTVEEEPEVDENGEGEILSGLNQKVKIVVPKEIAEAAGDLPLIWKSSNEDIASIDENGIVNPSALGRTILTASIENTASRSAETVLMTIEFWVTELVADVPETLAVGSTAQASYMVDAGADKYTKSINAEWESSDPTVVKIDSDGNMTAVAEGQATITLTTDIGTKTAVVTVEAAGSEPETLSISPADVGLTVGNKLKLSAQGANGREVLWTTSNSFAVQVDGDGWLAAIAPGSATVTATIAGTTISSSVYVTVFERTTGIEETETSEPHIAVEGNMVTVEGIVADVTVEVYNMAGSRIASRKGSCAIAIDNGGIYLVRIGSMVRKVAVKR